MHDQKQRAINVMLGIHLGDAMGVPFEMMTREQILAAVGPEGVTGPRFDLDPAARKLPDTRGLPPGSTSDDSQLAGATADGLIMAGRYVHELHVLLHLKALWHDVAGWGGTTKRSLYELDKWYRSASRTFGGGRPPTFKKEKDRKLWEEAEPRDPAHPARRRENARGNGPSMKIAPMGIRYGLLGGGDFESGEALDESMRFSRMTHADPVCAVAAYAIAGVVSDGFSDGPAVAIGRLLSRASDAEVTHAFIHGTGERFTDALRRAMGLADDPPALWAFGSGGRSDSMTSVPMALAIWLRHARAADPQAALLEAINAGGDTDTVGAMVGAMMGAMSDRADWWPAAWVESLRDRGARAKRDGQDLYEVCGLHRPPPGYDLKKLKRELGYL